MTELDRARMAAELDEQGWAVLRALLDAPAACDAVDCPV